MGLVIPRRRRLLLDHLTGIPRQGLVGMYLPSLDGDARNLLAWSEDITKAVWATGNATVNDATHFTATAQGGNVRQNVSTIDGVVYTISFRAKVATGPYGGVYIRHTNSATGGLTGITLTSTLTTYSVSVLGKSGGGSVQFGIQDNQASAWQQIEVTDWQVNVGSLQPYQPVTDKQLYLDRSGYNLHGQLGSTANGDTNDPRWDPDGLFFTTDDYVNLDAAGPIYGAGYTILMVVKGAAGQTMVIAYGEGNNSDANPRWYLATGLVDTSKALYRILDNAGALILSAESTPVAFDSSWHLIGVRESNGTYTLFVDGVKEQGTYTPATLTVNRVTVGALGKATYSNYFTGSLIGPLRWRRPISDAEYERTRRELRRLLAAAPTPVVLP